LASSVKGNKRVWAHSRTWSLIYSGLPQTLRDYIYSNNLSVRLPLIGLYSPLMLALATTHAHIHTARTYYQLISRLGLSELTAWLYLLHFESRREWPTWMNRLRQQRVEITQPMFCNMVDLMNVFLRSYFFSSIICYNMLQNKYNN